MAIFNSYVSLREGMPIDATVTSFFLGDNATIKSLFDLIWVFWLRHFNDLSCTPNFDLPSSAVNLWGNLHLILRSPQMYHHFLPKLSKCPNFHSASVPLLHNPTTFSQNSLQHFAPPWSNFPPTSNMFSDFPTAEALHWRHQFLKESTDQKTWCAKQFQKVIFSCRTLFFKATRQKLPNNVEMDAGRWTEIPV